MLLTKEALFSVERAKIFKITLRDGAQVQARKLNTKETLKMQETMKLLSAGVTDDGEIALRNFIVTAMFVLCDASGKRHFDVDNDEGCFQKASVIEIDDAQDIFQGYWKEVNPKTDEEVKEHAKNSEEPDQNSSGSGSAESSTAPTQTT